MTTRFLTAASVLALVSACSSQPGPSSVDPVDRGYSAYRAGNYAAAEQAYASALAAAPNREAAMLGLAEVYDATGRSQEAAALYRQVHAARSGTIRVWNDGRAMQDGVTEVAGRRLGALMTQTGTHAAPTGYAAPTAVAPVSVPPGFTAPQVDHSWPDAPTYGLDADGIVYYADPEGTQPITEPVYATPQLAGSPTIVLEADRAYEVYRQPAPVAYTPAPVNYAPAPTTYAPEPTTYAPAPMTYEAAPISYQPAPAVTTVAPAYAPIPAPSREAVVPAAVAPAGVPGYAVVNGNFVYISAEDIANGATPPSAAAGGYTAENYGTPTPVSASPIPAGTPSTYSAPRGVDVMNGIAIPNLN